MSDARLPVVYALGATALAGIGLVPLLERPARAEAWFEVQWPRDLPEQRVVDLLRHLAASRHPRLVAFEVQAHLGRLEYRVGVPAGDDVQLPQTFASFVPGVVLEALDARPIRRSRQAIRLRLQSRERPLRTDAAEAISRSVISALAACRDETVVMQWLLGHRLAPMYVGAHVTGLPSTPRWLWRSVMGTHEVMDARAQTELRRKVGEHGFRATLRIGVDSNDKAAGHRILRRIVGALRVAEGADAGLHVRSINPKLLSEAQPPKRWARGAFNVSELAGLLAWPIGSDRTAGIERVSSRRLAASLLVPSTGRIVADGNEPLTRRPLGQDIRDALMNTHVIGPTGTGKSTLLARLILDDIATGRGVAVIDVKGDLVRDVAARVPAHRLDDVVIFEPTDDAPVGFNPLHAAGRSRELVADGIVAVFRGLYGDTLLGPRSTDVLHNSLMALAGRRDATLCALPLLLSNERYRREVTSGITDALTLGPFWQWFEGLSVNERSVVVAPVMNKVRPFLREGMRAVLGQAEPRFDVSDVFTRRKVLLVSLAKGVLGEQAALLGSLIVSQLWRAAQARAAIAPERRHPVICYVDEFQDYLHLPTDFADVLAQTRGLGMGLVASHQHLAQLTPSVRAAVLANARFARVCFRLSAEDAAVIARTSDELEAQDFQSLGRYEVYASLLAGGQSTPFASGTTRPLPPPTGDLSEVRARSRTNYGRRRAEIEAELAALVTNGSRVGLASPIGKKRRGAS